MKKAIDTNYAPKMKDNLEEVYEYLNLISIFNISENESIDDQYWYLVHKTVQRVKAELLTLAVLDIRTSLPKNISYKNFLEDLKKHKDWDFSTRDLTKTKQRMSRGRVNVTKTIIDDLILMQIEMGFPIVDEIIKYDADGKRIGLSSKPSSRKMKLLGKQLGLGELFILYQTIAWSHADATSQIGSGVTTPIRFSEEKMDVRREIFKLIYPQQELKNSMFERVAFNLAVLRLWQTLDYNQETFAGALIYLVELYINDKSWWFWRDSLSFILAHQQKTNISHEYIIANIVTSILKEIDPNVRKHLNKERKFLKQVASKFADSNFNSLNDYVKHKYFIFK